MLDSISVQDVTVGVVVLLGACAGIWKFFHNKWKKRFKKIEKFAKTHSVVHDLLTELRVLTEANRATILCLHNGGSDNEGFSMRKFSASHESCRKENSSQIFNLTNCLCSLFSPILNYVIDNKPVIIRVEDIQSSFVKHFFVAEKTEYISVLPVYHKGMITNFILLQWQDPVAILHVSEIFNNFRTSIEVQLIQQESK